MTKQKQKKFSRTTKQRKALFRSLLLSLFLHGEIKTTLTKAKLVKRVADSLVSKAKEGSLSVRRQILAFLPNKKIVNKLVDEIAPRFAKRVGGFTRMVRIGRRRGDNAMMAKVELIKPRKNSSTSSHRPTVPANRCAQGAGRRVRPRSQSGNQRGKAP